LALAIGLGACLNAGLLYWQLRKKNIFQPQAGWRLFAVKVLTALGVMAACLWLAAGRNETWLAYSTSVRILHLSGLLLIGAISYFAMLWLLGLRLKDFMKRAVE
jgi:putative peptidoglycan lipid II flippase